VCEIPLSVRAVPEEETKRHWGMWIGFFPRDWELGHKRAVFLAMAP
jgi:hypothetical protein